MPFEKNVALGLASLVLVIMALQYPLQTTFPIGGDAVRYVARAIEVLEQPTKLFRNSNYPGSILVVATTAMLPISWPERFIWAMVFGHIATGLALGWLLNSHFNWPTAVLGICSWSFFTTIVSRHIEIGTLAQLLSLPILLLTLDRLIVKDWKLTSLFLIILPFFHPFSTILIICVILLYLPLSYVLSPQLQHKSDLSQIGLIMLCAAAAAAFLPRLRYSLSIPSEGPLTWQQLWQPLFIPFLLLAPFGFWNFLFGPHRERFLKKIILLIFTLSVLLFSFTNLGGLNPYPHRFDSVFVLVIVIFSSIAIVRSLPLLFGTKFMRFIFLAIFITTFGAWSWQLNSEFYSYYELSRTDNRPSKGELVAMNWLNKKASSGELIATKLKNRNSEWLPILTRLKDLPLYNYQTGQLTVPVSYALVTHGNELNSLTGYFSRIIFQNQDATVYELISESLQPASN